MATSLIQMAVGHYDVTNVGFHRGVFLRDVTSEQLTDDYLPLLEPTKARLDWMLTRAGEYPFDTYGCSSSTPISGSRSRRRRSS